jgi:hypothetical protein
MDAAVAQVRSRLQAAIATKVAQASSSSVAFPELASISYLDLPNTTEGTASVRVHEKAHVELPVFDSSAFALAVASMVSADAESGSVRLVPSTGYGVKPAATSVALGQDPLSFSLTGTAMLVWNVDTQALANSLAGKDQSAFQTVVNTFAGIQEARARIEPFWKSSFPSNASSIRIIMSNPAPQP